MDPKVLTLFWFFVAGPFTFGLCKSEGSLTHYAIEEKYSCVNKLDVFFDRAVLLKYSRHFLNSWPGNTDFDCSTKINSRTKGMGLIGIIKRMDFRRNSDCIDYVSLPEKTFKLCGEIRMGFAKGRSPLFPPPPPQFISEFSGPFSKTNPTYYPENDGYGRHYNTRNDLAAKGAFVSPDLASTTAIRVSRTKLTQGEELDVEIVFTGYRECEGDNVPEGWFSCGYGVCILKQYLYDGIVNCPFGDCRDEGSCEMAMLTNKRAENRTDDPETEIPKMGGDSTNTSYISLRRNAYNYALEPMTNYSQQSLEQIKKIGESFEIHNGILQRISDQMESAVEEFKSYVGQL